MGFPIGYSDLFIPKLLIPLLTLMEFIRKFCHSLFSIFGLVDFFELETTSYSYQAKNDRVGSVSAALIRELLPVVKFADMDCVDSPDNCAVCLYEFGCDDEIRRLRNCRHIFHRSCVDRWMDHDQTTCPLCRTDFVPADYYTDHSHITTAF